MDVSGPLPGVKFQLSAEEPTNLARLLRKPGIIELARLWKPKRNYTIKLATSKRWLFPFMSEMREGKSQRPISISPVRIIDYSACECINPSILLWSWSWGRRFRWAVFSKFVRELCLVAVSLTVKPFHPPLQQGDRVLGEIGSHIHVSWICCTFWGIKTQMPW